MSDIQQFRIHLNNMKEQSTVKERIKKISEEFFNGNASAMARSASVKQATLRDIISEKVKPSYDTIRSIVECSTINISTEWLITGKGTMYKREETESYTMDSTNLLKIYDQLLEERDRRIRELEAELALIREQNASKQKTG